MTHGTSGLAQSNRISQEAAAAAGEAALASYLRRHRAFQNESRSQLHLPERSWSGL